MILILLVTMIFNANASDILTFEEIKSLNRPKQKIKPRVKRKLVKKSKRKDLSKELELAKKKLKAYQYIASMQLKEPIIFNDVLVAESDYIGASSVLAVRASNSPQIAIFSSIKSDHLDPSSRIICNVMVKHRRVCGVCERIIIGGRGYDISATLNNKDGSACSVGKVSDDGEKYLTGVALSEMAKGALSIGQSAIPTPFGNILEATAKNQIKQGLINVGDEASEIFKEEYQTKEPIVTMAPNTPVVIQFTKAFSL